MGIGSISAILMSILFISLDMTKLKERLSVFFILQGVVRGHYAAANKATYADHFTTPNSEAAFSNLSLQSGLSASLTFFLLTIVPETSIAIVLLMLGAAVVPGY